jgi:hypothetical protein
MTDQDQLRGRAARLLAIAHKAREQGHLDNAERFTQRAAEILEPSTASERLGTQSYKTDTSEPKADRNRHRRSSRRARMRRAGAGG